MATELRTVWVPAPDPRCHHVIRPGRTTVFSALDPEAGLALGRSLSKMGFRRASPGRPASLGAQRTLRCCPMRVKPGTSDRSVHIPTGRVALEGDLALPDHPRGVVLFATEAAAAASVHAINSLPTSSRRVGSALSSWIC
jgi:hypothetical protein